MRDRRRAIGIARKWRYSWEKCTFERRFRKNSLDEDYLPILLEPTECFGRSLWGGCLKNNAKLWQFGPSSSDNLGRGWIVSYLLQTVCGYRLRGFQVTNLTG